MKNIEIYNQAFFAKQAVNGIMLFLLLLILPSALPAAEDNTNRITEINSLIEKHVLQVSAKDLEKDLKIIDDLLKAKPSDSNLLKLQYKICVYLGKNERKEAICKSLLNIGEKEFISSFPINSSRTDRESFVSALEALNTILAFQPDNLNYINLKLFYLAQLHQMPAPMLRYYDSLPQHVQMKVDPVLLIQINLFRSNLDEVYKSFVLYQKQTSLSESESDVLEEFMTDVAIQGQLFREAWGHIKNLQKRHPEEGDYSLYEVAWYLNQGQTKSAQELLEKQPESVKESEYYALMMAFYELKKGNYSEAIRYTYKAALDKNLFLFLMAIRTEAYYQMNDFYSAQLVTSEVGDAYSDTTSYAICLPVYQYIEKRHRSFVTGKELSAETFYWGVGKGGAVKLKSKTLDFN